jgi:peptidoglycan hydrolase CwlO-like protein
MGIGEGAGVVTSVITILLLVGAAYGGYRALRSRGETGDLAGADSAMETWHQVHEANRARIEQLEADVMGLQDKERQHVKENAELRGKVEILEQYSAPEAITRFEQQQVVIIEILRAIQKNQERPGYSGTMAP